MEPMTIMMMNILLFLVTREDLFWDRVGRSNFAILPLDSGCMKPLCPRISLK